MRTEENFTNQKSLSISYLQTDYLNLDISSSSGRNNKRENIVQEKKLFVDVLTILQRIFLKIMKDKEKYCVTGDSKIQRT